MECVLTKHGVGKEENNVTWSEYLKVIDSVINYHVFVAFPFCKDGYKHEIQVAIEKRSIWKAGMLGITRVESAPINDALYYIAFAEAYRKVYEREAPDPYADINISIEEFLDMVDDKTQIVRTKLREKYAKYTDHGEINALIYLRIILTEEGFKPQDSEL